MYDESFAQLLQSLAGIYRAYYELVNINEEYKDKVQIVIIVDGYETLGEDFLKRCEDAAIYNFIEKSFLYLVFLIKMFLNIAS